MNGRAGFVGAIVAAGLVGGLLTGAPPALAAGPPGTITTVAGGPGRGDATRVFQLPIGVAAGPSGAIYVADQYAVRDFTSARNWEGITAGIGVPGFSGDGGPASRARLGGVGAVTVDRAGNVLIVDTENGRVRVVAARSGTFYGRAMTAGDIYTIAGNGGFGYSGDGGPATSATMFFPGGIAVDGAGNLVIADTDNYRVRVVAASSGTFYGQAMTAGDIYTVAGNGTLGYSGDGGPATSAELGSPQGVAVDAAGNVVITDTFNNVLRVVAARSGTFYGRAMTAGDIYTVAGNGTMGYSGDGGPATSAELNFPTAVAVDSAGNLVVADFGNNRVRVVAARSGMFYGQPMVAGDIYTVAGDGGSGLAGNGGPATSAALSGPQSVTFDSAGNLVIADTINHRVRVVAARTGEFYGRAMVAGDIYVVAGNSALGSSGSGGKALNAELFAGGPRELSAVAVDSGNYVVLQSNQAWFICSTSGTYFGQPMVAGHIYVIAGDGYSGYRGDGGPATSARIWQAGGVAVDAAGNLVIADTENLRVRVVAARSGTFYGQAMTAGDIYTVAGDGTLGFSGDGGPATAAELDSPQGIAVDAAGNLVIGDTGNDRVRVVAARSGTFYGQAMTAGDIYTVAGNGSSRFSGDRGPATSAGLDTPEGVAVDGAGNLAIVSTFNNRVRVVAARSGTFYGQAMTAGDIYAVAGNGDIGFSGDGGPGTSAKVSCPEGVAFDAAGNLVIGDTLNNRVRVVAARSGRFYGQAMTAGDIYTVAGKGTAGFSGDGGPATSAELDSPQGVAVDGAGNLVISDSRNARVRLISE